MYKRKTGFTLIEILVAIAILAVLAGVALPVYNHVSVKAKISATKSEMKNIAKAIRAYAKDMPYDPKKPRWGRFPPEAPGEDGYPTVLGLDLEEWSGSSGGSVSGKGRWFGISKSSKGKKERGHEEDEHGEEEEEDEDDDHHDGKDEERHDDDDEGDSPGDGGGSGSWGSGTGWDPVLRQGWNGPYLVGDLEVTDADGDGEPEKVRSYQVDAWGRYYIYTNRDPDGKLVGLGTKTRVVRLVSGGPDRDPSTEDDNITLTIYRGPIY
jgi:prepilin-type N-terminal cleavage/methylation domain-containing protein